MEPAYNFDNIVHAWWFVRLDLIGTVAFALSGITIARSESYSLTGAFVLASLPAIGGSLIMDLIAGRKPVGIIDQPSYIIAIIVVVLTAKMVMAFIDMARGRFLFFFDLAYFYVRLQQTITTRTALVLFDSIGLASFTATGVLTAIQFNCRPFLVWGPVFAVLNASFGTVLRDVFRADAGNPVLKGSFYAEIAAIWGVVLTAALLWLPAEATYWVVVFSIFGVSVMRMVVYKLDIRAPMF
ncbi:membrane protein [Allostella sp. ATCC 35155]|nr:membrane protein [Stella sp. ATCC 35155]